MAQVGNKQNAGLNGEWCKHIRNKRPTSKKRRAKIKEEVKKQSENF